MRKLITVLSLTLLAAFASVGCGQNACEEAADKVISCMKNVDCNALSGLQRFACEAAKLGQTTGASGTCEGQAKTAAETINQCAELDPAKVCAGCKTP